LKALFLDVHGVLTCNTSDELVLDALLVARVTAVVRRTGCVVVLSSTLRVRRSSFIELQRQLLHRLGDPFRIFDRTPDCAQKVGLLFRGYERGAEISAWLSAHPEVERFAIVDDCADMGPLRGQLVQTNWSEGIQDEHVERLVALLGERAA
jgi:hypothetical protein